MPCAHFLRTQWFRLGLAVVFLLPWIAFGRSLFQDFAAIDDAFLIVNNPIVHGMDFWRIKLAFTTFDPELYIPFTLLSFQVNWVLGHGMPFLFHATNLLLHSTNAVLVAMVFLQWTKSRRGALTAALIFAVHPLNTEAVVWAAGRKDLLCTFFVLLTLISVQAWHDASRSRSILMICALLSLLSALLSKALAVTLPAVLLLSVFVFGDSKRTRQAQIISLIGASALSALFVWIASSGKQQILASSTLWETIVMAQKSAAFYIMKFLMPMNLTVIYPYQETISLLQPTFFFSAVCTVALLVSAVWQRNRRPLLSFGILFYFITLSPTFLNFHKGDLIFFAVDRYAYLPEIGLLLAGYAIISELTCILSIRTRTASIAIVALLLLLSIGSMAQTRVWDTPDSLFGRSIELYPESVSARTALANIFRDRNQLPEAFALVHEGARVSNHPALNIEAGLIYSAAGQVAEAREQFQLALQKNEELASAMYYLGFLDEHNGATASAENWYRKAIASDPSYVTARVHLARLLLEKHMDHEAEKQLDEALRWNPVSVETLQAHVDLARATGTSEDIDRWTERLRDASL